MKPQELKITTTKQLNRTQQEQLMLLWNKEYPEQLAYKDIREFESYLTGLVQPTHYLLIADKETVMGWAFTFTRDGARWFAIILNNAVQYQGYGTKLIRALQENEQQLNGWATDHNKYFKKDKSPYIAPVTFYLKNGFKLLEERFETEKLSAAKIFWQKKNATDNP